MQWFLLRRIMASVKRYTSGGISVGYETKDLEGSCKTGKLAGLKVIIENILYKVRMPRGLKNWVFEQCHKKMKHIEIDKTSDLINRK